MIEGMNPNRLALAFLIYCAAASLIINTILPI
jgi:hypothetical protein